MAIIFSCPCGARLHARRRSAGKTARCPVCIKPLLVPDLETILTLNPSLRGRVSHTRPDPPGPSHAHGPILPPEKRPAPR
jgi:hypothetical protein